MRIAIIGAGNVGGGLAAAAVRAGHDVVYLGPTRSSAQAVARTSARPPPRSNTDAVQGADVVVLAVPGTEAPAIVAELGEALAGASSSTPPTPSTPPTAASPPTASPAPRPCRQPPAALRRQGLQHRLRRPPRRSDRGGHAPDRSSSPATTPTPRPPSPSCRILGFAPVDAGGLRMARSAGGDGVPQHLPQRRQRLGLAERLEARRPDRLSRRRMSHHDHPAVRLNHAVLFVADLERARAVLHRRLRAWRSSPASPAPTPRSCGCRARATTTTSACSASARRSRPATRRHRPLPPRLAGRHDRRARAGPPDAGRARAPSPASPATARPRASTAPTPTATSSRSCGCCPATEWGEYENAAPIDRLDLHAELPRWTGVRTAGELVQRRERVR